MEIDRALEMDGETVHKAVHNYMQDQHEESLLELLEKVVDQ
jgi:uncharacterized protein YprB with RNaseH-like and TPR domain